jgi:hypothetical protein
MCISGACKNLSTFSFPMTINHICV